MADPLKTFRRDQRLRSLASLPFNYDDSHRESLNEKLGWNIDRYSALIACEKPGEPVAGGPFLIAKRLLRSYRFTPRRLVRGSFLPRAELVGRDMLLRARFLGFNFYFGTRINQVIDELRGADTNHPARVWGYSYRTLQGHFEMGEIKFEIIKWLQTGDVEFHINAYSKSDHIPNIFYRWGFRFFGRALQKYFAHASLRRMRELVAREFSPVN